ncbi:DUF3054 domain-containing protein [Kocuria tytonis]|uniref:DUF3054 domain-containing protein n=1 Tax=Kocuria tytonis TaxID=2054280 RepID=A0A495AAL8_9MICC|nr:DUF3054 domain-containing protein [Kocuria tytonis]RKQ37131.1 DUF3054 domain-containing protein [Kocuria tytonis]
MQTDSAPSASPKPLGSPSASRSRVENRSGRTSGWPVFLVADLVLVLVFAAIGRASHGESPGGLLLTAWPFLIGALVGWLVCRGSRHPAAVIPTGLSVWLCAEVGGMVLRALTGQGTALPFVVVSIVMLGVLLTGYRLILVLVARVRRRTSPGTTSGPRTAGADARLG